MESKEFKVVCPDGYEVDVENSSFECIKFRPKKVKTYEDVAKALFKYNRTYYYSDDLQRIADYSPYETFTNPNNSVSEQQVEKLIALNKLSNVDKYLNGDWKPDFTKYCERKWCISFSRDDINYIPLSTSNSGEVFFKTEELAKQAVEILGIETVALALKWQD